ncbi:MAG: hypothetical protein ACH344_08720 [Yersinia sp. (in: enterobacteria)]|jgi:hypothetical protein
MATLEKHVERPSAGRGNASKGGSSDLPHGRKGGTESMAEKMDYSEKGSRSHGKTHKDCY